MNVKMYIEVVLEIQFNQTFSLSDPYRCLFIKKCYPVQHVLNQFRITVLKPFTLLTFFKHQNAWQENVLQETRVLGNLKLGSFNKLSEHLTTL